MWAQIDYSSNYPFSKLEKETIKQIRELMLYGKIDSYALYKYGNIVTLTVGEIFNISKKEILDMYDNLKIYSKDDIDITILEISKILKIEPCKKVKDILSDIEYKILSDELENKKDVLVKYINDYYGDDINEKQNFK